MGVNNMIPDIRRSLELAPDTIAFQSWHDILLVMVTAASGSDAMGIDIDQVMAENEAAATDDPMAFYNFVITGAGLSVASGWPERAALMLQRMGADYELAIQSVGNTSSGQDQLMRTPFARSGVAFAYGEIFARAGYREAALEQWTRAVEFDTEGDWSFRDYTQNLIDDIDTVMAEFDALEPNENAFDVMRVQSEAACSLCHVSSF